MYQQPLEGKVKQNQAIANSTNQRRADGAEHPGLVNNRKIEKIENNREILETVISPIPARQIVQLAKMPAGAVGDDNVWFKPTDPDKGIGGRPNKPGKAGDPSGMKFTHPDFKASGVYAGKSPPTKARDDAGTAHHVIPWEKIKTDLGYDIEKETDKNFTFYANTFKIDSTNLLSKSEMKDLNAAKLSMKGKFISSMTAFCWAPYNLFGGPTADIRAEDPSDHKIDVPTPEEKKIPGIDLHYKADGSTTPRSGHVAANLDLFTDITKADDGSKLGKDIDTVFGSGAPKMRAYEASDWFLKDGKYHLKGDPKTWDIGGTTGDGKKAHSEYKKEEADSIKLFEIIYGKVKKPAHHGPASAKMTAIIQFQTWRDFYKKEVEGLQKTKDKLDDEIKDNSLKIESEAKEIGKTIDIKKLVDGLCLEEASLKYQSEKIAIEKEKTDLKSEIDDLKTKTDEHKKVYDSILKAREASGPDVFEGSFSERPKPPTVADDNLLILQDSLKNLLEWHEKEKARRKEERESIMKKFKIVIHPPAEEKVSEMASK